jgi:hypothetical protein
MPCAPQSRKKSGQAGALFSGIIFLVIVELAMPLIQHIRRKRGENCDTDRDLELANRIEVLRKMARWQDGKRNRNTQRLKGFWHWTGRVRLNFGLDLRQKLRHTAYLSAYFDN